MIHVCMILKYISHNNFLSDQAPLGLLHSKLLVTVDCSVVCGHNFRLVPKISLPGFECIALTSFAYR